VSAIVASNSEGMQKSRDREGAVEKEKKKTPFDILRSHKTPHKKHVESITFGDIYPMLILKSET